MFATAVAKQLAGQPPQQAQLYLRALGLSPSEIGTYDKPPSSPGTLDESELKDAFDLLLFDHEEAIRFYSKGPGTSHTVPAANLPKGADINGDGVVAPDEWLSFSRRLWLTKLSGSAPDMAYQNKVIMLWVRTDLAKAMEFTAQRLFPLIDSNGDNQITGDEITAFGGNAKTFEAAHLASSQGLSDLVDPIVFTRIVQFSSGTFIRRINDLFTKLDRMPQPDGQISKAEMSAGANDPSNENVPAAMPLQKETVGHLEFERTFLRNIDQRAIGRAFVKWTWPADISDP